MKKIAFIFGFFAFIYACSSGDSGTKSTDDGYDRTALLTNWADNIIIPSYQNYQNKVQTVVANTNAFTDSPSETNLQTLRTSWVDAYKAYQYLTIFNFGKAVDINFKDATNTYATDVPGIEANIKAGIYDLTVVSQLKRQGLPAMDYMLNGLATDDSAIVGFYTTNDKAANYKKYLTDLANQLKINIDIIVTHWTTNYRATYISKNGTTTSDSFSITTNTFIKSFEKDTRLEKVGYPSGTFAETDPRPQDVEAIYKNDISKDLLNISVQASQDFFNGKHFNGSQTGPSLKSYLDYLNATKNGSKLTDIMNNQYATIFSANSALDNSFTKQIATDNSKLVTTYNELQNFVVLLKLDMLPAFKYLKLDYVDNDGD